VPAGQRGRQREERLAQQPLHPVALHSTADLAADRDAEPRLVAGGGVRKRVDHQLPARVRAALTKDPVELGAPGQALAPAAAPAAAVRRRHR
jgi:hypothetical protein